MTLGAALGYRSPERHTGLSDPSTTTPIQIPLYLPPPFFPFPSSPPPSDAETPPRLHPRPGTSLPPPWCPRLVSGEFSDSSKKKSMSYFQATTCKPHSGLIVDRPIAGLGKTCRLLPAPQCSLGSRALRFRKLEKQIYPRLVLVAVSHKRLTPVCASSGKGNLETDNDALMDDLNKALAEAKKPRPIQDVLKDKLAQLREQASGGGGGGGNGNRRGGNGGSGGPEDESFKESLDEIVQVILATVAFILVYIHIIRGEELYRLARDYTRFLVTGKRTARLKRSMQQWRNFSEKFMRNDGSQEERYERLASSEPMWWQQPQKFVHLMEELCRGTWRPHAQKSS